MQYIMEYGTNETGVPKCESDGRTYRRLDTYTSNDGTVSRELVFVAGADDSSNWHNSLNAGYNIRCGLCWLGFTHSEDCHNQRVDQYIA